MRLTVTPAFDATLREERESNLVTHRMPSRSQWKDDVGPARLQEPSWVRRNVVVHVVTTSDAGAASTVPAAGVKFWLCRSRSRRLSSCATISSVPTMPGHCRTDRLSWLQVVQLGRPVVSQKYSIHGTMPACAHSCPEVRWPVRGSMCGQCQFKLRTPPGFFDRPRAFRSAIILLVDNKRFMSV